MTIRMTSIFALLAIGLTALPTRACGAYVDLDILSSQAISQDPETAKAAAQRLRRAGPEGLAALMKGHAAAIEQHRRDPTESDANWDRIAKAIDTVAAQ